MKINRFCRDGHGLVYRLLAVILVVAVLSTTLPAVLLTPAVAQSQPGANWTAHPSGTTRWLIDVTWGDNRFVVVGEAGTILTSPDGVSWTEQDSGTGADLTGVAWGADQFVAVGGGGTILTSPDGVSWTVLSSGTNRWLYCVTWGVDQFVAVGGNVGDAGTILTSPDGVNWTEQDSGTTNVFLSTIWGANQFLAVGGGGTILTSPDGVSWTEQDSGMNGWLRGVTWGDNRFVIVGEAGTILTSPDGVNWTEQDSGTTNDILGTTWGSNQFVALAGSFILTSPDGVNWTPQSPIFMFTIPYSVTWGSGKFVAVGNNGMILTSGSGDPSPQICATIDLLVCAPELKIGQEQLLQMTFTNTGTETHTFIAGASLWKPGSDFTSSDADFEKEVTLAPGAQTTVSWTHTVDFAGDWGFQFAVWKARPFISDNLLVKAPIPIGFFTVGEGPDEADVGRIILVEPLSITHGPYIVGGKLTATFKIKNVGDAAITLDKLLLGGRHNGGELPGGGYPDFTHQSVTLQPGQTHQYQGTWTIPEPGEYNFFIAYYIENPTESEKKFLDNNNWNTAIELGSGLTDEDRTKTIFVETIRIYKVAYIPVQFKDAKAEHTIETIKIRAELVKHYYYEQSFGNIIIQNDFIYEHWETLPLNLSNYKDSILNDAIKHAELSAGLDIDTYDCIVVITTDKNLQPEGITLLDKDELTIIAGRKAIISENHSFGVLAHELGHGMLGWNDRYASSPYSLGSIYQWGLMGSIYYSNPPPPVMAFNKVKAGWLNYKEVIQKQEIKHLHELQQGDNVYIYTPKSGNVDYFIFEGRTPKNEQLLKDPYYNPPIYRPGLDPSVGINIYQVEIKDRIIKISGEEYILKDTPHIEFIKPQSLKFWENITKGERRVTLKPDDVFEYTDIPNKIKFTAHFEGTNLMLSVEGITVKNKKVIIIQVFDIRYESFSISALDEKDKKPFGINLQLFTEDGRMVGYDHDDNQYRFEIEGAITSGPQLGGGTEWISVPNHEEVLYSVDTTLAQGWMEANNIKEADFKVVVETIIFDEMGEGAVIGKDTKDIHLYLISASANPKFGGEVTGGGGFARDQEATVNAKANTGYIFTNWTEAGAIVSTGSNYSFNVTESRNLVANFVELTPSQPSPPPTQTFRKPGDVTGNGKVDIEDVILTMQHVLGIKVLTSEQKKAADVNKDGKIDILDVTLIMRFALGLINSFD